MQDNRTSASVVDRRAFLRTAGRTLGAVALVGAWPAWRYVSSTRGTAARRTAWAMGTDVHLTVPNAALSDPAARAAFGALGRVQASLSAHDAASLLGRMNASAGTWLDADDHLVRVGASAIRFADLTDGAMDVTVLPALRAWGFMPGDADPSFRDRIGIRHLHLDGSRARIDEGGYAVDFGGIAKGYGVDEGLAAMRTLGVDSALLEAGGDLYAMGRPEPDRMWSVGVRDPRRVDRILARFDVEDEAVATSGTYLQKRVVEGREVSHLVDPRTGDPVAHVRSATVVAPDAMTADALATAACVMPVYEALRLFETLPGVEALWIPAEGDPVMTPGMRRRLVFV